MNYFGRNLLMSLKVIYLDYFKFLFWMPIMQTLKILFGGTPALIWINNNMHLIQGWGWWKLSASASCDPNVTNAHTSTVNVWGWGRGGWPRWLFACSSVHSPLYVMIELAVVSIAQSKNQAQHKNIYVVDPVHVACLLLA